MHGWDYSAEIAGQFGNVSVGGMRLDHRALAADAMAGHTWTNLFAKPRLGLGYTYASGDSNANDDKNQTFDLLFGTNHRPYGMMDLWGLRNVHSPRLMSAISPVRNLLLTADYYLLWLADTHDFFFPDSGPGRSANGYGRNSQFKSFVGSELDVVATYNVARFGEIQLGYGHFFVGDYIEQSLESIPANGGVVDADWFYVQLKVTF